jgi:hypothetical protein
MGVIEFFLNRLATNFLTASRYGLLIQMLTIGFTMGSQFAVRKPKVCKYMITFAKLFIPVIFMTTIRAKMASI